MSPLDPPALLLACHDRIRRYVAGLERLAALPDLRDPRVPSAAEQARRYFTEAFPLHAADEDLSLAPRLRVVVPECVALLDAIEDEHAAIDACLATLVPQLDALAADREASHPLLRVTVARVSSLLLPHIAREEDELFPLWERLPDADRVVIGRELVERRSA
jgi:hemerythrin-like domain-containing protein